MVKDVTVVDTDMTRKCI